MADLLQEPGRFDFYQAMRLVENGAIPGTSGRPIGFDDEPRFEIVRLRGAPSLGFPVNAIDKVTRRRSPVAGDAKALDMTVTFMGALGAQGVMPWHYTEYVYDRLSKRDKSLLEFVDTLQHRSIAFHYRAWRKYRLPFAFEAAARKGETDDVTMVLRALVGLGTDHLRERLAEGADRWLYFGGLFARAQRTSAGLEAMLQAVCGHSVQVQEFVGRWQELLAEERSRLGGGAEADCRNELGGSCILGDRVWDVLSGVHIRIGPVDSKVLPDLVPRTGRYPWLGELVRSYLGPNVDFEISCLVERSTIKPVPLGSTSGATLGGSAWLGATDSTRYDTEVPVCSSR